MNVKLCYLPDNLARPRFIKSSEILSRQTTVDSLLLSVTAGQPSDLIAILSRRLHIACIIIGSLADVQPQSPNCHRC